MATPILALIPSGYKSEKVYSVIPSNGDGDFTFTREGVSGQPNSTRVNKDGLIEEVNSNVPRLDYSDGSCPSLLLENQSTNLLPYSEDFSDSSWQSSGLSVSSNQTISPDSTLSSDKLIEDNSNINHQLYSVITSVQSNNVYTLSLFAKKGERDIIQISVGGTSFLEGNVYANFDLANGSIGNGNYLDAKIVMSQNDWYKCSVSFTTISTSNFTISIQPKLTSSASRNLAYQGDGTSGLYIWGAQLEESSISSSYIPTNGAIATRLIDQASNDFSSQPTVANTNTVVLKFIPMGFDTDFYDLLKFSDGTNDLRIEGFQTNNYDVYGSGLSASGMIDGALQLDAGSINTISFSYSGTSLRFSHNGSTIATTTPTGNLPTITEILHTTGASSPIKILKLEVYNDFKTQEELNSLTNSN